MMVGTLDGIKHNPILGWGVGSFIPIMSKVEPKDSEYLGVQFNTPNAIMNHPHNELLSGWWKIGISFPILISILFINFLKTLNRENIVTFTMVLIGGMISMGWFFTMPLSFLFISAFAIHENITNRRFLHGQV